MQRNITCYSYAANGRPEPTVTDPRDRHEVDQYDVMER